MYLDEFLPATPTTFKFNFEVGPGRLPDRPAPISKRMLQALEELAS